MTLSITEAEMEEKLNALCVRTVDYKDNDRLITLCTAEKGKILAKATGCKTPKAKLKYAASPLCFGEYLLIDNGGRYTLKGCEAYDTFQDLAVDIKRYYAGFSILEWLDKLSNDDETATCRELLSAGVTALKNLTYEVEIPPEKPLCDFLVSSLEILGYGLNFDTCAVSGKRLKGERVCYDFFVGGVVCYAERSMDYADFSEGELQILTEHKNGEIGEYAALVAKLESILTYSTGIKKNYSLSQFFKIS